MRVVTGQMAHISPWERCIGLQTARSVVPGQHLIVYFFMATDNGPAVLDTHYLQQHWIQDSRLERDSYGLGMWQPVTIDILRTCNDHTLRSTERSGVRREKFRANLPCLCTSGQAPYRQPDGISGVPGIAAPLSNIVRSAKTYLVSKVCRQSSLSPLLTLMRKTLTRALQSRVSSPKSRQLCLLTAHDRWRRPRWYIWCII